MSPQAKVKKVSGAAKAQQATEPLKNAMYVSDVDARFAGFEFLTSGDTTGGIWTSMVDAFKSAADTDSDSADSLCTRFAYSECRIVPSDLATMTQYDMLQALARVMSEVARSQESLYAYINRDVQPDTEKEAQIHAELCSGRVALPSLRASPYGYAYDILLTGVRMLRNAHISVQDKVCNAYVINQSDKKEDASAVQSGAPFEIYRCAKALLISLGSMCYDLKCSGVISRGTFDDIYSGIRMFDTDLTEEADTEEPSVRPISRNMQTMSHAFSALYISMLVYRDVEHDIRSSMASEEMLEEVVPSIGYLSGQGLQ